MVLFFFFYPYLVGISVPASPAVLSVWFRCLEPGESAHFVPGPILGMWELEI